MFEVGPTSNLGGQPLVIRPYARACSSLLLVRKAKAPSYLRSKLGFLVRQRTMIRQKQSRKPPNLWSNTSRGLDC